MIFQVHSSSDSLQGGDHAQFQLIQTAYDNIKQGVPDNCWFRRTEDQSYVTLSAFGPEAGDTCIIGHENSFQKRKSDIYEALKLQISGKSYKKTYNL